MDPLLAPWLRPLCFRTLAAPRIVEQTRSHSADVYAFTQEHSARPLPYVAHLSQLPFGARRRAMSAVLTPGSPMLADYSLYMTNCSQALIILPPQSASR